jgi:hypothetical protein
MEWMRFLLIVVLGGVATSLTDWFFAGDWIHKRFPSAGIWREGSEARAIAITAPLPFLTCAVFAYTAYRLDLGSLHNALKLAAVIWVMGPLPLILTGASFIKMHRVFAVSYAIGWLVKLMIVAALVGRILR